MAHVDPRTRRLNSDHEKMIEIQSRSDFITFETPNQTSGMPPETYVITYRCKGISGIESNRNPVYSEEHKVEVYLHAGYPNQAPKFKWLTPIWHPNIEHKEPFRVCIDNTWWAPGRGLHTVATMLGEMVQYKNYHPYDTPPYPIDREAAQWAMEAEQHGWIGPDHPVDDRELLRPQRIKNSSSVTPTPAPTQGGSANNPETKPTNSAVESSGSQESGARPSRITVIEEGSEDSYY